MDEFTPEAREKIFDEACNEAIRDSQLGQTMGSISKDYLDDATREMARMQAQFAQSTQQAAFTEESARAYRQAVEQAVQSGQAAVQQQQQPDQSAAWRPLGDIGLDYSRQMQHSYGSYGPQPKKDDGTWGHYMREKE